MSFPGRTQKRWPPVGIHPRPSFHQQFDCTEVSPLGGKKQRGHLKCVWLIDWCPTLKRRSECGNISAYYSIMQRRYPRFSIPGRLAFESLESFECVIKRVSRRLLRSYQQTPQSHCDNRHRTAYLGSPIRLHSLNTTA